MVDGGLQHFALRAPPEAIIDQLRIARHQLVFQMGGALVERGLFDAAMRRQQDGAAGRLIDAARLHADKAIFQEVQPSDAMLLAIGVERGEQRGGRHLFAID